MRELWKDLSKDGEFFLGYRDKFRENFLRFVDEERSRLMSLPGINTLVERLYLLLFSFKRDPTRELFNISYTLARSEIDLKKVIEKAFLALLKDYIDHIILKDSDHERVKKLIDLIDLYLSTVEEAHLRYVEELRDRVKASERAVGESERRIALGFLEKIKKKEEINLLSYYKGLPVACTSKILGVEEDSVRVATCSMDILDPGREVYLKHPNLPKPIETRVLERDLGREEALLKVVGFKDLPKERRKYLRVRPEGTVKVSILKGSGRYEGVLADISVGGIGVYLEDPGELKKGDEVMVRFSLPKGEVEARASVRYVLDRGEVFRVGLQYQLDIPREEIVSDYVMERQFEILRELKGL